MKGNNAAVSVPSPSIGDCFMNENNAERETVFFSPEMVQAHFNKAPIEEDSVELPMSYGKWFVPLSVFAVCVSWCALTCAFFLL